MSGEPRIRIDVPLGTSLEAIMIEAMEQAWRLTGTQLMAGVSLGIRPETLSRRIVAWKKKMAVGGSGVPPEQNPEKIGPSKATIAGYEPGGENDPLASKGSV